MTRVCANPVCDAPSSPIGGRRCNTCASYLQRMGTERPERLVRWPGVGHPLATSTDVTRMTGLSYRQVDYAIRSSKIVPTIKADGSGTTVGWTLDDVAALMACIHVAKLRDDLAGEAAEAARTGRPTYSAQLDRDVTVTVDLAALRRRLEVRWPDGRATHLAEQVAS